MFEAITGLSTAFGLAGSAGLNAYIPLLAVALAARFPLVDPLIKLEAPFDLLGTWWAIAILGVLLAIEVTADKIPAVDTINDGIQTFVRPAAGAILFAGSANVITEIHPILSLGAGLMVAGGVHATKSVARPVVTATTAGTGNWAVSTVEDLTAVLVSFLALVVPIVAAIVMIVFVGAVIVFLIRRRQKRPAL